MQLAAGATTTGFAGRQSCMGVRGVCVRMFFQPAQSNFGKSEAISYVNPSKFRPGGQQQFSYSQTPRSRQDLRGVRGVCVRLPTSESGCGRPRLACDARGGGGGGGAPAATSTASALDLCRELRDRLK